MLEPPASAVSIAVKALSRRELSAAEVAARLRRAGLDDAATAATIAYLRETGQQSDGRAAAERARVLAGRCLGDIAISADLAQRGLMQDDIEIALTGIPGEVERAMTLVARRPSAEALARALRSKGYSSDTIEHVLGPVIADES